MTKRLEERRDEILREKFKGKGPCLIPKPEAITENSMLTTCHENDFCKCDMEAMWNAAMQEIEPVLREVKEQIREASVGLNILALVCSNAEKDKAAERASYHRCEMNKALETLAEVIGEKGCTDGHTTHEAE